MSTHERKSSVEQRDRYIKLFNRLEAAITHHRNAKLSDVDTSDEIDEALWAARGKILRDASIHKDS